MPQIFEVGGCVRDSLLGIQSKDIDYTFVNDDLTMSVEEGFQQMTEFLQTMRFKIFLSTPEMFTIRAKFPDDHQFRNTVADFVMARKEVGYIEGTRRPQLVLGNLYDDLQRRDFTVNAIARDVEGNLIDPFNGQEDLKKKLLKTPIDCNITFNDDPLRILRAIRFAITKGFTIPSNEDFVMRNFDYDTKMHVVSHERIREELIKCFKHNTRLTLIYLDIYHNLKRYILEKTGLWLKPTFEQ